MFGITDTAASHIVKQGKGKIQIDQDFQNDYAPLNSQVKT